MKGRSEELADIVINHDDRHVPVTQARGTTTSTSNSELHHRVADYDPIAITNKGIYTIQIANEHKTKYTEEY